MTASRRSAPPGQFSTTLPAAGTVPEPSTGRRALEVPRSLGLASTAALATVDADLRAIERTETVAASWLAGQEPEAENGASCPISGEVYPLPVDLVGMVIGGRYEVVRMIGEGGMGAVFEALDRPTGSRVALKIVVEAALAKNSTVVKRFQREARATETLETSHIARVLDAGTDEATGVPFMVMDLLEGRDLKQLLDTTGALPVDVALRILGQACEGLLVAHAAGIVHRDIKSANLFLADEAVESASVKILDFGIAKAKMDQLHTTEGKSLTGTGSLLGTPLYMSPEQAQGEKTIDHRTDVWSLGVVLYEMLTGRTPHGDSDSLGKLIIWICSRAAPPVQDHAPWVSPEVAAIVHRALELEPDDRFPSVEAMLVAIRELAPHGFELTPAMLAPLPDLERDVVAVRFPAARAETATPSGVDAGDAPREPTPRRSRWSLAPFAALVGAAALGLLWAVPRLAPAPAAIESSPPLGSSMDADPAPAPTAVPAVDVAPVERHARLAVAPAGVFVEVDRAPAPVLDGAVAIAGLVGSKHEVRLSSGGAERTFEVVLTVDGIFPEGVALEPQPGRPPRSPTGPASTAATSPLHVTAPAASPEPPAKPPPVLREAERFE